MYGSRMSLLIRFKNSWSKIRSGFICNFYYYIQICTFSSFGLKAQNAYFIINKPTSYLISFKIPQVRENEGPSIFLTFFYFWSFLTFGLTSFAILLVLIHSILLRIKEIDLIGWPQHLTFSCVTYIDVSFSFQDLQNLHKQVLKA